MIALKDSSVRVRGMTTEILFAMFVANDILKEYNSKFIITSINDGIHSETSSHYAGNAFDIRVWYIKGKEQEVASKLQTALGPDYGVFYEKDHIHVQYKPRRES